MSRHISRVYPVCCTVYMRLTPCVFRWTCIYPIYIDAKHLYRTGERRIARAKSIWWPLSKDIAEETSRLGLGTLHEVNKTHPRDWENSGRVRVQWRKDGQFMNSAIRMSASHQNSLPYSQPSRVGMVASRSNLGGLTTFRDHPTSSPRPHPQRRPLPRPSPHRVNNLHRNPNNPQHCPPSHPDAGSPSRQIHSPPCQPASTYSPAISSGVLIETLKAGMNAQEGAPGAAPGSPGVGGVGKGKRRVVRVRR
jgi:signal recognition particle subunit SRP19